MYEYKLQAGCLIIIGYFIISYLKATHRYNANKYYVAILITAPWAIIFDAITAWTVNRQDVIPAGVNLFFHLMFFLMMILVLIELFIYIVSQSIGIKSKRIFVALMIPGLLALIGMLAFIKDIYYVEGETTYYSFGTSVIVSYSALIVHVIMIIGLLLAHHKTIERKNCEHIVIFLLLLIVILTIQCIWREALITALMPTIVIIGIYISFENPAMKKLRKYNEEMVTAFATLVENRDDSTGGHIKRTKGYVQIILDEMKKENPYKRMLTEDYVQNVINAAPMHDIGKIGTPDKILQKPGKLTEDEFEIMKEHARMGGKIIEETFSDFGESEYVRIASEVASYHHEKWNGKGYPDGLKGEDIPLHARIMAIADVFDAVSAKRCYRDALPIDECFEIIEKGAGVDFDPRLVKLFLKAKKDVLKYYNDEF